MTTTPRSSRTWMRRSFLVPALLLLLVAGLPAMARAASPVWQIRAVPMPTNLPPNTTADLNVTAPNRGLPEYTLVFTNVGAAPTSGAWTITDTLPAGITEAGTGLQTVTRTVADTTGGDATVVQPNQSFAVNVPLAVGALPEGAIATNHVTISGGGAAAASSATDTTVSSAEAPFGIASGALQLRDPDGGAVTQAGSHPAEVTIDLTFPSVMTGAPPAQGELAGQDGGLRDLSIALPQGFVVDPSGTPVKCTEEQLETLAVGCPVASQVGVVDVLTTPSGREDASPVPSALYNMQAPPGAPAEFAFDFNQTATFLHVGGGVRSVGGAYRLTSDTHDIIARLPTPVLGIRAELWSDPSDPLHDTRRGNCVNLGSAGCSAPRTSVPLISMPSTCSAELSMNISDDSWFDHGTFVSTNAPGTDLNGDPIPVTGCSLLPFNPQIGLLPDAQQADSSSGMDVDLSLPQSRSTSALASSTLKKATITLPEGMALNPSSADGLVGCTESEVGLTSETPIQFGNSAPTCPGASKVGSGTIATPLLPDLLDVDLYVADPNDNPFHSLLSGYLVAHGAGVLIKLAARFDRNPDTGQITAVVDQNPQLPFSELKLHFKSGDKGVLVTPSTCGTYSIDSKLSPWSAADPDNPTSAETKDIASAFTIDRAPGGGACVAGNPSLAGNPLDKNALPFDLAFSAGTVSPQAGAYSPFVLKVSKPDGTQDLKKVAVTLPLGLTAKLAGVARCGQSAIVPGVGGSTNCPAGSQVGTVTVGAGAGSSPFFLQDQPVYLTDGYDGAPFGLVIDTHALAGPFDLGHVVVRTKLSIDPITAQVSADAEPLPGIIQGIPLHIRSVTLKMDRSSFVLNPTSCSPQTVAGQITGGGASFADPADDTVKGVSSAFQVGGCSDLGLSPKLAISLTGKGQTTDDKHPGVHATVSQPAGQANLKKVVVSLPLSLALDPDNANGLCEFADGSKVDPTCPKASIVGKAVARTPILDQPLTGPVYFVKNIRKDAKTGREIRTLPKLVIPLTGENGLRLDLVGTSNVVNNRLVTTFDNIPDAPVSDFTLDIAGGKGGILVVSGTDICKATQVADQQIDGQNGKTADASVYLQTSACQLKIISKKVGKTSVAVKVGGLGAGKVTVTGHGIKKTSKTIAKSTVATITAKRTKGKPGKVTVSFDPTGPAKARKTSK